MAKTRLLLPLCAALMLALPAAASAYPGQLDPTFAGGKIGAADIGPLADLAQTVTARPDGELVIAGASVNATGSDVGLLDVDPNGTPHGGFGTGGHALVTTGGTTFVNTVAVGVRPDGSLLVAATTTNASPLMIATVSPNGTASAPTYNALPAPMSAATDVAVDGANGLVYFVGRSGANNHVALARYTAAGTIDSGFGTAGVEDRAFGLGTPSGGQVPKLVLQADGKPVVGVAGVEADNTTVTDSVLRFTTAGAPDSGFGNAGEARIPGSAAVPEGSVTRITTSAAGVALISSGAQIQFERFTPDGNPVTSFSGDGVARAWNSDLATPNDLVLADDGTIYTTGTDIILNSTATSVFRVVSFTRRFLPDGTVDPSWGREGEVGPVAEYPAAEPEQFSEAGSMLTPQGLVVVGSDTMLSTDSTPTPPSKFGFARLKTAANQPPVVSLAAAPANQTAGSPVSFTATASDPDVGGSVVSYQWDFDGDGTIDRVTTTPTTSFVYDTPGSYTAAVTAIDNEGGSTKATTPVTIAATADQVARALAPAGLKAVGLNAKVSKKPKHGTRTLTISFTKLAGAAGPVRGMLIITRGRTVLAAQSKVLPSRALTFKLKLRKGQKLKLSITLIDRYGNVRTITKTIKVP